MFHIYDIQKNPDGIAFDKSIEVTEELKARNAEILDLSPVNVTGKVRYEAGFYFLDYQMDYRITLASSRSLLPVEVQETVLVNEIFVDDESLLKDQDLAEAEMVLVIEDEIIQLVESVADNILLNIPIKILTPEEEAGAGLQTGNDWAVLTEDDFQTSQQEQKEANSPFAQLQGLFDQE